MRWAALQDGMPLRVLLELLATRIDGLRRAHVRALWCVDMKGGWLNHALRERGFRRVDEIVTFEHRDGFVCPAVPAGCALMDVDGAHLDALAVLDVRAFAPQWHYPAFVLRAARVDLGWFRIAWVDGAPAGYLCASLQDEHAHVVRLAVDPAHGRRGIGGALLGEALVELAARGMRRITLNTAASLPAGGLYRKLGFRPLRDGADVLNLTL